MTEAEATEVSHLENVTPEHPLVQLARATIEAYVREGVTDILAAGGANAGDREQHGVFVSLHRPVMRGCIGTFAPRRTTSPAKIIQNAISSATQDPRFMPVGAGGLGDLEINVDVLSAAGAGGGQRGGAARSEEAWRHRHHGAAGAASRRLTSKGVDRVSRIEICRRKAGPGAAGAGAEVHGGALPLGMTERKPAHVYGRSGFSCSEEEVARMSVAARRTRRSRRQAAVVAALLFASLVCFVLFAVRVVYAGNWAHVGLLWNLSWPGCHALRSGCLQPGARVGQAPRLVADCAMPAVWLLFLPNAPYLLTDILHLRAPSVCPSGTISFCWWRSPGQAPFWAWYRSS